MSKTSSRLPLIAGMIALVASAIVPAAAPAREPDQPWWDKSKCIGLEGLSWSMCQKARSQRKRDIKAGRDPNQRPDWTENSKCLGLEGVAWGTCQKARSQRKRDIKAGRDPNQRPEWWEKSKCLGLEGLSWIECQKALKQKKRARE
jgi:hypothetical protein